MNKITTEQYSQIESTLEIRGDVEIFTLPVKLDGYWYVFEGVKFIFVSKDLAPAERESLIHAGLEQLKTYSKANGEK